MAHTTRQQIEKELDEKHNEIGSLISKIKQSFMMDVLCCNTTRETRDLYTQSMNTLIEYLESVHIYQGSTAFNVFINELQQEIRPYIENREQEIEQTPPTIH